MGSLYRLGQKFVDFCNVVQQNQNSEVTVPSSKVLYDETVGVDGTFTMQSGFTLQNNSYAKRYGNKFEVRFHVYLSGTISGRTHAADLTFSGKRFIQVIRSVGGTAKTQNNLLDGVITGYMTTGTTVAVMIGDYISTPNPKEVEIYFCGFLADE